MQIMEVGVVYGLFRKGMPAGCLGYSNARYLMFMEVESEKKRMRFRSHAVVVDRSLNLFYIIELSAKESEQSLSSSSSRSFHFRGGRDYKVKILDRCVLKNSGELSGFSKILQNL